MVLHKLSTVWVVYAVYGGFAMFIMPQEEKYFMVTPADNDVFVGDILNLTCTLNSTLVKVNSSCLYFTKKIPRNATCSPDFQTYNSACTRQVPESPPSSISYPSPYKQCAISSEFVTIINSTSVKLQYPVKVPKLDEGHYICRALDGVDFKRQRATVKMYSHAAAVTNVSCVVDNFTSMTCQWGLNHVPLENSSVQANLTWGTDGSTTMPCPEPSPDKTRCSWPPDQFSMGSVYTMMVTVFTINRFGGIEETVPSDKFTIDPNLIVQLPPVDRLKLGNINSTCILLSWQQHKPDVECRVRYNCSVYESECKPPEGFTSNEVQICGLIPWTIYQWSVSCRPDGVGYWSQDTSVIGRTVQDSPWAPPDTHPGSYTEVECDQPNCRDILLYWRNLPPHYQNGELVSYHIVVTDLDHKLWDTIVFDYSNQTSHNISLRQNTNYKIQINVCTKKGCSDLSTPVRIFKQGKAVPAPRGFAVELANATDPTYLNMSWETLPPSIDVVSYTIFWCKGTPPNCKQSPLDWHSVSRNTTAYNLTLPGLTEDTFRDYIVGVSAEARMSDGSRRKRRMTEGVSSSGIAWSPCLYGHSTVPTFALKNVRKAWSPNSDSVEIAWDKLTCQQTPSVLTGVLVVYCPTGGGSVCSGPKNSQIAPGMVAAYSVTGLEAGATYSVVLYAMTRAGTGPPSLPVVVTVKSDLQIVIPVVITFAILLLVLLIVFFTVWGIRKICSSKEKITIVGEEKLLDKQDPDVPPPPPVNPPPDSRSSVKNGSYKQKNGEKDIENVQLLRADFYKENPSPRTSAPVKVDNCYMVPPNTRPQSRHSKRNSENNNNPPMVAGLEAKSEDSFPLLDFTDEGIPRERVSSFKSHLVTKDYGFAVKGGINYEDVMNRQLEREKAENQESVGKDGRQNKSPPHKKTHTVSFSEDDNYTPPPPSVTMAAAAAAASQPRTGRDAWRPSKKERRWSRNSDRRLSRDSDFPTPPPTPPLDTGREQRFSGQDFFPTPPPPPSILNEPQEPHSPRPQHYTPEMRYSGKYVYPYPTPPPPPEEEYRPVRQPPRGHAPPPPQHVPIPSPKHRTREVSPEAQMRRPPAPNEVQPQYGQPPPPEHAPIPSPKHRTKETKPETHQRHQPPSHEVEPVFKYPTQDNAPIPSPKQRTREPKPESMPRTQPPPREVEPVYRYPSQEDGPSPSPRAKPEPQQRYPPAPQETAQKSPVTPDRLSKALSEADPDSTIDISFLLEDLLGEGVKVKRKPENTDVVKPKPRQHTPVDPAKTEPEFPEVEMRPKPQPTADPGNRQSRGKSNPPKVAPKPVVKNKDSMYATSPTSPISPPPRTSSQNPEYMKIT